LIFLGDKIEDELVWAVRCKGCGELYAICKVGAGEVTLSKRTISCHKTHIAYEYRSGEIEEVWAP
jgi:rRNA maturation endonuclease Nob1